ncbi:hypothetical protein LP417_31495 [Polaromonas sp. P1-6]|nr:hypothetical protein LP417_31495 [Polaromonas sp. P1-6]
MRMIDVGAKCEVTESSQIGVLASDASTTEDDRGDWYVAYTQPKREQVAVANLEQQGFEAYLPQYKAFKKSPAGVLAGV